MTRAEHEALWARAYRALMPLEPILSPEYRPGARGVVVLADDDWASAHGPGGEDAEREASRLAELRGLRLERADVEGRRAWVVSEGG